MAHRGLSTSFCAARAARRRRRRLEESEYMRGRYIPWKRGLVLVRKLIVLCTTMHDNELI